MTVTDPPELPPTDADDAVPIELPPMSAAEEAPAAAWAREDGLIIPDITLIRRIGSGSYGEVWLAQTITGALRAVKVVWREDFEQEKTFRREFEGIEQFEPISRGHPGLVNILHVGWNEQRGFYYYVMELGDDAVHGTKMDVGTYEPRTLSTDFKRHGRLNLDFCKQTGIFLADALGYMHSYGLTHRDIKPSNIIFVAGVSKLADIGLVAMQGERAFVGTDGFVPPEGPGTFAADVYSLGKVLYEISSGNDRMEFPAVPDDLTAQEWVFWREWNAVICKACAPDEKKRYATAADFATDLHHVGVPRPVPLYKRLARGLVQVAVLSVLCGSVLAMLKREKSWRYLVQAPDATKLTPNELAKMKMPNAGKLWINSAGMKFTWRGDKHIAERPVNLDLFSRFLNDTSQPFEGEVVTIPAKTGPPDPVVVVPQPDARGFCEWLTTQDRNAHALTDDFEYKWQPDPGVKSSAGARLAWTSLRLEVVKRHFGSVEINSTPDGAEVFQGSTLLGITPLNLDRVRVGDFSAQVHLQGYKRELLNGKIKEGGALKLSTQLKATGAVVFGTRWRNSLDIEMVPVGNILIAATETRRQDFAIFLRQMPWSNVPTVDLAKEPRAPMTFVNRAEGVTFCHWLTDIERARGLIEEGQVYRLPTDDEWSMAAGLLRERGESPAERNLRVGGIFVWGYTWPPSPVIGNFWDSLPEEKAPRRDGIPGFKDGFPEVAPVGSFPPDDRNLYDLAGNVWEWIEDNFGGADAKNARLGVVRGGSWRTKERTELMASFRKPLPAAAKTDDIGFRIVLSPVGVYARDGD